MEKLGAADRINFNTLLIAARSGQLALVRATRKKDRAQVALVCAMSSIQGSTDIRPVPLAVMVEGNPFEDFEDPTQELPEPNKQNRRVGPNPAPRLRLGEGTGFDTTEIQKHIPPSE